MIIWFLPVATIPENEVVKEALPMVWGSLTWHIHNSVSVTHREVMSVPHSECLTLALPFPFLRTHKAPSHNPSSSCCSQLCIPPRTPRERLYFLFRAILICKIINIFPPKMLVRFLTRFLTPCIEVILNISLGKDF